MGTRCVSVALLMVAYSLQKIALELAQSLVFSLFHMGSLITFIMPSFNRVFKTLDVCTF